MGTRKRILAVVSWLLRASIRPKVLNREPSISNLTIEQPSIIISNHTSITNGPLLMSVLHGPIVPVVAEDWYSRKEWKQWLDTVGCIPCRRQGVDTTWLRAAVAAISSGKSILIFPEGKVRKDGIANEYKGGFALLAAMTGAPVIPVTICNRYSPLHPARITIDPAVYFDKSKAHDREYLSSYAVSLREQAEENKRRDQRERGKQ